MSRMLCLNIANMTLILSERARVDCVIYMCSYLERKFNLIMNKVTKYKLHTNNPKAVYEIACSIQFTEL